MSDIYLNKSEAPPKIIRAVIYPAQCDVCDNIAFLLLMQPEYEAFLSLHQRSDKYKIVIWCDGAKWDLVMPTITLINESTDPTLVIVECGEIIDSRIPLIYMWPDK